MQEVRQIVRAPNSLRLRPALAVGAALAFALVVLLALLVSHHPSGNALDDQFARRLGASDDSRRYRMAEHVGAFGSQAAVALIAAALAGVCWWRTRNVRLTLLCVLAPGLAGLAQWLLKEIVRRPAPGEDVPSSALSFPSGHAAGAWALAVTVVVLALVTMASGSPRRLVITGAVIYAIAVATARVVVEDHYATDVIGGALLGLAVALALAALLASSQEALVTGWGWRRGVASTRR